MSFWLSLLGYQAVWLAAVIGAGHGTAWPGVLGMLVYAVAQLLLARNVRVNLSLMAAGLVLGFLFDGALLRCGLASYASGWPDLQLAPAWILALWISFALTFIAARVLGSRWRSRRREKEDQQARANETRQVRRARERRHGR